jgi:hypothetical protein
VLAGVRAVTIDTLAYAKHLEQAGVERRQAEALAEALNRFVFPDLATNQKLASEIAALEHRLMAALHTIEIRSLGIIAAMLGLAVTIIKWV